MLSRRSKGGPAPALTLDQTTLRTTADRLVESGVIPTRDNLCRELRPLGWSQYRVDDVRSSLKRIGQWSYQSRSWDTDDDETGLDNPDEIEIARRAAKVRAGWDEERWAMAAGGRGIRVAKLRLGVEP